MLRIGLIGAGWHALAHHAPALQHLAQESEFTGQMQLSGVCDVDAARAAAAAERYGFRASYGSIDAMLPHVDAAISVLPAAALLHSLELILRSGIAVLIEKPLGTDLAQAREIAAVLGGHRHMVSLNRRFDPGVRMAQQWMLKRSPPRAVHGLMSRHHRREADFIWSTGVHLCDLMCFLVGPLNLLAATRAGANGEGRIAMLAGEGVHGTVQFLPDAGRVEEMVQIVGEQWSVQVVTGTHQAWQVQCWRGGALEVDEVSEGATPEFIRNGTADETRAFVGALLSDQPLPGPTAEDALPGTALASALQDFRAV